MIARFRQGMKLRQAHEEEKGADNLAGYLVADRDPSGTAAEAYRNLRTNLLHSPKIFSPKVIVLTSPGPRKSQSIVGANLGVVLAQAGKRSLLVDCDFRRPSLHKVLGTHNILGLVDMLTGESDLREVLQEPVPGMKAITAGPVPFNPAELLGSERFAKFLDQTRREFEYVIIDTPSLDHVSDAAILASQVDGVLLVLDARNDRKKAVQRSMRSLENVGANVLGTVLANVKYREDGRDGGWTRI